MKNTDSILELHITELGGLGDGIALHEGVRIYVPYTMPGDVVRAKKISDTRATLIEIISQSPHRVSPPCEYFGTCGGCDLQHLSEKSYRDFKMARAKNAIIDAGYSDDVVEELLVIPPHTRRRAEFKIDGNTLGYFERESHNVCDISHCLLLAPELETLIAPLHAFIKNHPPKTIALTLSDSGIDAVMEYAEMPLDSVKSRLRAFAEQYDLARISIKIGNPVSLIHERRIVTIKNGSIEVELPQESFLQASRESQILLTDLVLKTVGKKKTVIDLFAGLGTYSFPLAERGSKVIAYEGLQTMVDVVNTAARKHKTSVRAEFRDLVKNPVDAEILGKANVVVINPPRTGAEAQTRAIARSYVEHVVMVSCNPATFSRDAKILQKAGFKLTRATPVDQFNFSSHLEIVGSFTR